MCKTQADTVDGRLQQVEYLHRNGSGSQLEAGRRILLAAKFQ